MDLFKCDDIKHTLVIYQQDICFVAKFTDHFKLISAKKSLRSAPKFSNSSIFRVKEPHKKYDNNDAYYKFNRKEKSSNF